MGLTTEQVFQFAPDEKSVSAGRNLAAPQHWQQLGHSPKALWGLCRGSAVYEVKVDLGNFGYHCTCPSRKFPCKHILKLLLLWAGSSAALRASGPPPANGSSTGGSLPSECLSISARGVA